jgi:hypothetical protein
MAWALICSALAALSVFSFRDQWSWRIDLAWYDTVLSPWHRTASDAIVVVAVDESSLAAHGRWPWPRANIARLFEQVAAGRPRSVAVDLFLTEPDADPAVDARLARAIEALSGSVLATFREDGHGARRFLLPLPPLATAAKALGHVHVEVDPDAVVRSVNILEAHPGPTRLTSRSHSPNVPA